MKIKRQLSAALAFVALPLSMTTCRRLPKDPVISFTLVPVADDGGPESLELIRGAVRNGNSQDRVVLYSYSVGAWWIQPFASRPFTNLNGDLNWQNSIHLGQQYAAILVDASYKPPAKLGALPGKGGGVLAVAKAAGTAPKPVTIQFGGYDWDVRQLSSNFGGKSNPYEPNNAWVDQSGSLHLKIVHRDEQWFCADVGLKESLGHGSYSFTVRNVSHLDPAAVLEFYTWDHFKLFNGKLGIDVSRWGDPNSKNGQFVINPSHEPNNLYRFQSPTDVVTFTFRWQPGKVLFEAWRGEVAGNGLAAAHTFTSGIPEPAGEKIHISLYVYGNSRIPMKEPAEVIIDRFQYAP